MGRSYYLMGEHARAGELLARSVEQMRALGNTAEEATAAGYAGVALAALGDFGRALPSGDGGAGAHDGTVDIEGQPRHVVVNSRLICATFSRPESAMGWGTVSTRVYPDRGGKEGAYSHGTQHDKAPEAAGAVRHPTSRRSSGVTDTRWRAS